MAARPVRVILVRRSGRGGAAGYADRLERGLRELGHGVEPRAPGWAVVRGSGVVLALERAPYPDVYRAGGGVHAAFRRALGRVGPSPRAAWDAWVARSARAVIANSRRVADELLAIGVPAARIELVRTGVDPRFAPGERAAGGRIVLFAGHGWRRKGIAVAARAFAAVRGPTDRLLVAGADSRRAWRLGAVRRHVPDAEDLGPWADLVTLLPTASVLLHPTRYDPASNLVMEAMACGVPPVTTRMDGSAELLPEPRLVVEDPRSVAQVAAALRFALDAGPALGPALVEVARHWPDPRNIHAVAEIAGRFGDG